QLQDERLRVAGREPRGELRRLRRRLRLRGPRRAVRGEAAEEGGGGGDRRRRPCDQESRVPHYFCSPCVSSAPLNGSATYGNELIGLVSPVLTPSPSGSFLPTRKPPTACS